MDFVTPHRCFTLLLLILTPSALHAQDEGFVELSETQRDLNESGVKAAIDGDFKTAVSMFESSAALGPANITFLNLGRAYHKLGRCDKARESFDKVITAPKVEAPTPTEIAKLLVKYEDDLVNCVEAEPDLANGNTGNGNTGNGKEVPKDPPPPRDNTLAIIGYTTAGLGVALLITYAVLDLGLLNAKFDERSGLPPDDPKYQELSNDIETLQAANLGLLISGGVLAATGVTLILVDIFTAPDDDGSAQTFAPWLAPSTVGMVYRVRF